MSLSLSSCLEVITRMWRGTERASFENKPSMGLARSRVWALKRRIDGLRVQDLANIDIVRPPPSRRCADRDRGRDCYLAATSLAEPGLKVLLPTDGG